MLPSSILTVTRYGPETTGGSVPPAAAEAGRVTRLIDSTRPWPALLAEAGAAETTGAGALALALTAGAPEAALTTGAPLELVTGAEGGGS
jgi:hypothetical protein